VGVSRPTEATALARIMMAENLRRQANDYDRLMLILNVSGWRQGELASVVGVTSQAVQWTVNESRRRLETL